MIASKSSENTLIVIDNMNILNLQTPAHNGTTMHEYCFTTFSSRKAAQEREREAI